METNRTTMASQVQSCPQVTNQASSLANTVYISRPISSVATDNENLKGPDNANLKVDSFNAEDGEETFDIRLPLLEWQME